MPQPMQITGYKKFQLCVVCVCCVRFHSPPNLTSQLPIPLLARCPIPKLYTKEVTLLAGNDVCARCMKYQSCPFPLLQPSQTKHKSRPKGNKRPYPSRALYSDQKQKKKQTSENQNLIMLPWYQPQIICQATSPLTTSSTNPPTTKPPLLLFPMTPNPLPHPLNPTLPPPISFIPLRNDDMIKMPRHLHPALITIRPVPYTERPLHSRRHRGPRVDRMSRPRVPPFR